MVDGILRFGKSRKLYDAYPKCESSIFKLTVSSLLVKILLAPAFLYYYFKKKTPESIDTNCGGYHVVAIKK